MSEVPLARTFAPLFKFTVLASAALAVSVLALPRVAAAETRTFVVGYFGQATHNMQDSECPAGINPEVTAQYLKNLVTLGYSQAEIDKMLNQSEDSEGASVNEIMRMRGRVNGQPTNPYAYPASVTDPKLNAMTGAKYVYGFDLDGKGGESPQGFEDPDTHEAGVDNQMARAFGCSRAFRGSVNARSAYWSWAWAQLKDSQPAWVITITGADLAKDGDVTVTFDRALHYLKSNIDGTPRADTTYRIDPDPRSHNVLHGRLKDGLIQITEHGSFRMLQNPMVVNDFKLTNTHLRLRLKPDGTLDGIIGGYQLWADIYSGFAHSAPGMEVCITGDIPGLYYLLKRHADAQPDPKTGENTAISTSYTLMAVPAFVVSADGKLAGGG